MKIGSCGQCQNVYVKTGRSKEVRDSEWALREALSFVRRPTDWGVVELDDEVPITCPDCGSELEEIPE